MIAQKQLGNILDKIMVDDGCWIYPNNNPDGYPRVTCRGNGTRTSYLLSRVMYWWYTGIEPGAGYCCHTCDNSRCVNPTHLYLGDQNTNMQDMATRKRHKWSALDWDMVKEIRSRFDAGHVKVLAKEFGVSTTTINLIVNNQTWKDSDYQPLRF